LKKHLDVDELHEDEMAEIIGKMTREEAVEFFAQAGVPAAPVYDVDEVVKDPHLEAREMFIEVEHKKAGTVKVPNFPVKYSETPGRITKAAPLLGEHNKEILSQIVGLSAERISELERVGIISSAT
jgi:crotonobetainyl-CoA:carnitine CoA-transferase CaiB-like acyl-CoA transferase